MASDQKWIVLINRAPVGPLQEEEIHALFSQNVLKPNDLALEIRGADSGGKPEWKFLWQFPQFDRRAQKAAAAAAAGLPPPTHPERRGGPPPKAESLLPSEISSIQPEDLIGMAKPLIPDPVIPEPPSERNVGFEFSRAISVNLFVAVAFFGVVLFSIFKPEKLQLSSKRPEAQRSVANETMALSPVRPSLPKVEGMPKHRVLERPRPRDIEPPPPPSASTPLTKDRGEVPRDEVENRREEREELDRQDSEEREKAEFRDDEEPVEGRKLRRKPKKRSPTTDEEFFEAAARDEEESAERAEQEREEAEEQRPVFGEEVTE